MRTPMRTYKHLACNGWPGLFINGDEALGEARVMQMLADAVERGSVSPDVAVRYLRWLAAQFETCHGERAPEIAGPDRYAPRGAEGEPRCRP